MGKICRHYLTPGYFADNTARDRISQTQDCVVSTKQIRNTILTTSARVSLRKNVFLLHLVKIFGEMQNHDYGGSIS